MSPQDSGQGSTTSYATPRDAKAQVKAEKAYRKASRPWFKKKRFWVLGAILLIVLISALSGGGDDTDAASSNSASDTNQETAQENTQEEAPPAFPGAKPTDVVGEPGEQLALGDVLITSGALFAGDSTLGETLCTPVSLENGADETVSFNAIDWKLQAPSGTILNTGLMGSDAQISAGEIAPGGTTSGDVCFDADTAETGQYVVLYEPMFSFSSDRGAWINNR